MALEETKHSRWRTRFFWRRQRLMSARESGVMLATKCSKSRRQTKRLAETSTRDCQTEERTVCAVPWVPGVMPHKKEGSTRKTMGFSTLNSGLKEVSVKQICIGIPTIHTSFLASIETTIRLLHWYPYSSGKMAMHILYFFMTEDIIYKTKSKR